MARVSLKDIARELQLSESLVSKVLSGRMGNTTAHIQVVKAIQRKARELGYRPNRTATALATGRHGVIAVFVHQHGEPGSSIVETLITGVAEAAAAHQQRLWLQFFLTREQFCGWPAGGRRRKEV